MNETDDSADGDPAKQQDHPDLKIHSTCFISSVWIRIYMKTTMSHRYSFCSLVHFSVQLSEHIIQLFRILALWHCLLEHFYINNTNNFHSFIHLYKTIIHLNSDWMSCENKIKLTIHAFTILTYSYAVFVFENHSNDSQFTLRNPELNQMICEPTLNSDLNND